MYIYVFDAMSNDNIAIAYYDKTVRIGLLPLQLLHRKGYVYVIVR